MSGLPEDRIIITAALTGAAHGKEKNPALPISPEEIIQAAVECEQEGAAIVHIHAREKSGKPSAEISIFSEIVAGIREKTDLIINLTTGGSRVLPREERLRVVSELKPEMASFSCGSTMTGTYDVKTGSWPLDFTLVQTYKDLEVMARLFKENGVRPELEIYDVGMLQNAEMLFQMGLLEEPRYYSFVTGIPGQIISGDVKTLLFLTERLPAHALWQVTGIGGKNHFPMATAGMLLGGCVRVGLEDCVFISKGVLAKSNGELVAKARTLAQALGKTPMTPKEARDLLQLKRRKS